MGARACRVQVVPKYLQNIIHQKGKTGQMAKNILSAKKRQNKIFDFRAQAAAGGRRHLARDFLVVV
jgi:hypothetical protein